MFASVARFVKWNTVLAGPFQFPNEGTRMRVVRE